MGGAEAEEREESQGRENILIPSLGVFVTGWRSWISKQNATARQGAREFSLGNVRTKQFPEGNVSLPPIPRAWSLPAAGSATRGGWGRAGGERERGREDKAPVPPSAAFPWELSQPSLLGKKKNNPKPFSTCQGGRGAAVSGKFRGISLVLLLLLFNSQGHGI